MKHIKLLLICILGLMLSSCHDEMFNTLKGKEFRLETSTNDFYIQYDFDTKKDIVIWRSYDQYGTIKRIEHWHEYETVGTEIKLYLYRSNTQYASGKETEADLKYSGWKDKPTSTLQYHETYLIDKEGNKYILHKR